VKLQSRLTAYKTEAHSVQLFNYFVFLSIR